MVSTTTMLVHWTTEKAQLGNYLKQPAINNINKKTSDVGGL